jgi:hypothetical protein
MICVTAENTVREGRTTVAVCSSNTRKQVLDGIAGALGCFCTAGHVETAGMLLKLR